MLLYVHRNRRFIRDGSPGCPPQHSHSSWAHTHTHTHMHAHTQSVLHTSGLMNNSLVNPLCQVFLFLPCLKPARIYESTENWPSRPHAQVLQLVQFHWKRTIMFKYVSQTCSQRKLAQQTKQALPWILRNEQHTLFFLKQMQVLTMFFLGCNKWTEFGVGVGTPYSGIQWQ